MNRVLIRIIGAPLLLAALALCVYIDHTRHTTSAVTVVLGVFTLLSFHELCAMARGKGLKPMELVGLIAIVLVFVHVLGIAGEWAHMNFQAFVVLFVALVLIVLRPRDYSPPDAAFTVLAFGYVTLLLCVIWGNPGGQKNWHLWLLFLVATNKGSDMAAYSVGKLIGRHKMAPGISPNKTWEGAVAGLIAGTLLGAWALYHLECFDKPVHAWAAAAGVTVAAQMGDLVKSAIKRWAGVKDSGRLLPEFGGALDMVDSFILSAPIAALLVRNL